MKATSNPFANRQCRAPNNGLCGGVAAFCARAGLAAQSAAAEARVWRRVKRIMPTEMVSDRPETNPAGAFSSQVESLGGSENATKQTEHFQAKWNHLAARKMRPNKRSIFKPSGITWQLGKCDQTNGSFSSQVEPLGDSENATKQRFSACPVNDCERKTH
jgi:hypothetical protein